jgi:16S rRNA (guanine(1405)-N(7))-methyltransferase
MTEGELVERLKSSRKYGGLSSDTLTRIARWSLSRYGEGRGAIKSAKRKLHQISGAFTGQLNVTVIEKTLEKMDQDQDHTAEGCRKILSMHPSTRERLPDMGRCYSDLFGIAGRDWDAPGSVLDAACGLNPFSLPWMSLPGGCVYHACDADGRLVPLINRFLVHVGREGGAFVSDLLVRPPGDIYDVALLLKLLPCLEQQQKGSSLAVIKELKAHHFVVSFPRRSLSGKRTGMDNQYERFMRSLGEELRVDFERLVYPREVFYVW